MDTVFFIASKIIWAVISPDSLIVLLGVCAWLALYSGRQKLSRKLLSCCALLLLLIGFLPLGEWLIAPLEKRFGANAALPARADGIIVLGGSISPTISAAWGQVELAASADRLTNFAYLAGLYPAAQLVFTGGSGLVLEQELKEAASAQILFQQLGISQRAILYESESRNTFENVRNSKALLTPAADENWVLVTSAFHMPRAIGVFCQQGWPVTPYPVDHYSTPGNLLRLNFAFAENLQTLRIALREWAGLIAYRLSGATARLLPRESDVCAAQAGPV